MVKRRNNSGFTLIETLMVAALLVGVFLALDGVTLMTVKRSIINSYIEEYQMLCQRAALEINGYTANAATIELLDTNGVVTTNPANTLVMLSQNGNTNAMFSYTAGGTALTGTLLITPYITNSAQPTFDYGDQITCPNGSAFWWTNGGFVAYAFTCRASSNNVTFKGAVKPPQ